MQGTLHFISGRLSAGKTTIALQLAVDHHAVFDFGGCVAFEAIGWDFIF
jgi:hypothetical protein